MTNPFFKYKSSEVDNDLRLTVLSSSFIPDSFPHRSDQIDQMVKILSSVMRNSSPSNLLLYGKSGTGKTSIAKKVSNLLKEAFPEKVKVVYINCQLNDSTYSVLVNAANSIIAIESEKIPLSGWTVERIYNELLRQIEKFSGFIVLILDEIDKLARKNDGDSLYVILKLADDARSSKVSFIGITNYTSFLETLDARVLSRLNQESIVFPSYNASQLRDILQERVNLTGLTNMVDESAISLCAAIGAREHGDARKAIDLMRISIEIGIRDFMERIGEENVYKARDKYEMNILRESINGIPLHSKILLLSAVVTQDQDRDNMITGEIYENYRKICDELGVQSLTSRRIGDLLSELDDLGLIITVTRSLGRYGRTRVITVPDHEDLMKKYLLEDEILSTFKGIKIGKQHRLKMETDESRSVGDDEINDVLSSKKE
jgi:cell division control protein 6